MKIHMKDILYKVDAHAYTHANARSISNEFVEFRVREQLSVQMVSWIQVSLAYRI